MIPFDLLWFLTTMGLILYCWRTELRHQRETWNWIHERDDLRRKYEKRLDDLRKEVQAIV